MADSQNSGGPIWGFPKTRGAFLGVPIIRTIKYFGVYIGFPYFGKLPYIGVYIGITSFVGAVVVHSQKAPTAKP